MHIHNINKYIKHITALFLLILVFGIAATVYADESDIGINFNGQPLTLARSPVNINGRVMVPFRDIFEAFDAEVYWHDESRTISAYHHDRHIVLTIGSETAMINGSPISLDVAPVILSDRALVPIRFVSESLNAYVRWDDGTRTVYIVSQLQYEPWPRAVFEADPNFFRANPQFRNEDQSTGLIPSNAVLARTIAEFYRTNFRYITRQYVGLQQNQRYNIDSNISNALREAIAVGLRGESFMRNFPVNVSYFESILKNIDFYVVTDPDNILGVDGYASGHYGNRHIVVIILNGSEEEDNALARATYITIHELLHSFGFGEPSTVAITHLLMRLDQDSRQHDLLVYNPSFDLTLIRKLDSEGRADEYFNSLWSNAGAIALWDREMPGVSAAKLNRARSIGETFVMDNREMLQIFESATGYCLFEAGLQMGKDWRMKNGEISDATQAQIDAARLRFNYMLDLKNRFAYGREDLLEFYLVLEWVIGVNHEEIGGIS